MVLGRKKKKKMPSETQSFSLSLHQNQGSRCKYDTAREKIRAYATINTLDKDSLKRAPFTQEIKLSVNK